MASIKLIRKLFTISVLICITSCQTFSPLHDDTFFSISWHGHGTDVSDLMPLEEEPDAENIVEMVSSNNEKYICTLPSDTSQEDSNDGVSNTQKSPHEYLAPIFKQQVCTYRIESYWTYEICHGKHLRQYHEERIKSNSKTTSEKIDKGTKVLIDSDTGSTITLQSGDDKNDAIKTTEYFLGYLTNHVDSEGHLLNPPEAPKRLIDVPTRKIDGERRSYFSVEMTDGTPCDVKSGAGRKTTVLYVCQPTSRNEMFSITETTSCEYEVIIFTPQLCSHPFYRSQKKHINKIHCVGASDDIPLKPSRGFTVADTGSNRVDHVFTFTVSPSKAAETAKTSETVATSSQTTETQKDKTQLPTQQHVNMDRTLLSDFLAGDYCLRGGTGWWRFEFCYGKWVHQYHDHKKPTAYRETIVVGLWNSEEHSEWAANNQPVIKAKDDDGHQLIKAVQHFYTNGDICDITGKPRNVIVQLQCRKNAPSPSAVILHMSEPSTCSYVLTVETLIVCDLLETADDLGLFEGPK